MTTAFARMLKDAVRSREARKRKLHQAWRLVAKAFPAAEECALAPNEVNALLICVDTYYRKNTEVCRLTLGFNSWLYVTSPSDPEEIWEKWHLVNPKVVTYKTSQRKDTVESCMEYVAELCAERLVDMRMPQKIKVPVDE